MIDLKDLCELNATAVQDRASNNRTVRYKLKLDVPFPRGSIVPSAARRAPKGLRLGQNRLDVTTAAVLHH
ncbi:hypothetical protein [Bradyrhizobium sp. Ec3.3]|uniref:hypothetical protein n=1 Tax=Bradyrhizobium sp. Ec3.3 TaxID=189753 RepID=UPI0012EB287E|nr:hypothetical protein [Bradyrhizobium sp. Ec3.3]